MTTTYPTCIKLHIGLAVYLKV